MPTELRVVSSLIYKAQYAVDREERKLKMHKDNLASAERALNEAHAERNDWHAIATKLEVTDSYSDHQLLNETDEQYEVRHRRTVAQRALEDRMTMVAQDKLSVAAAQRQLDIARKMLTTWQKVAELAGKE